MPDTKISASPPASPADADLIPIVQGGANKHTDFAGTKSFLKAYFDTVYNAAPSIPADSITSGFAPLSLAFKERALVAVSDLIDPDFIQGRWIWDTADFANFLSYMDNTYGTIAVSNGMLTVAGNAGDGFNAINQAVNFDAPSFAIQANIIDSFNAGTADKLVLGIQTEHNNVGGGSGLTLVWDRVNNAVYINETIAGSSTARNNVSITLTPPFDIALSVSNRSVCVLARYPGKEWFLITSYTVTADTATDLRVPANLAAMKWTVLQWIAHGNASASYKMGRVQWGYLKGFNYVIQNPATFADGTPLQDKSEQFFMGYTVCPSNDVNEAVPASCDQLFAIDPTKGTIRTQAKIFTLRGGKIYAENSGSLTYDPVSKDYIFIIPNWGDYTGTGIPVYCYMYRRKQFPSGVIVLDNPTQLQLGTTNHIGYDPDLRYSGGLWYLVHADTDNAGHFAPVLETSPDLVTWTIVNRVTIGTNKFEGPKFINMGGARYIVAADYDNVRVYDMTLTYLGSFSKPSSLKSNYSVSAHPTFATYHDGPYQRLFWLWFDNAGNGNTIFTWGRIHLMEATTKQTGHDFSVLSLPL